MQNSAFAPALGSNTVLVGLTAAQVTASANSQDQVQRTAYRIRCLVAGYLAWAAPLASGATPSITAAAPTAGVPSVNTVGMSVGQVEVLIFPANAWFLSSVSAGFELTFGEGV